ncbi:alpha-N-acetylglucosaminyltransferase [Legionella sainthelensi]|uniref:Alpha-N-acetylglucosaminyltransferase n=1 Tax=Legionella sainthelensi TaxID=28087 RepID=A0A0W0YPI3_9GAMM|nr:glycosyltransferase family 4 protein [Legionella sainthelensi]KTD58775.1 alpha-N-acetylglucosaminyltransferase [Legionella sainthelensi]VEH34213.1 alpha-N-acetylglucosaminyltransferase [Legionella sainthelensi]
MNLTLSFFFLVFSIALTKLYCIVAQDTLLMDQPNNRSMHSVPTVRGGGLIFISLALISLPVLSYITHTFFEEQYIFLLCTFVLAAVSFLDDLYHLSVKIRFCTQSGIALLVAIFMRPAQLDLGILIHYSFFIIPFIFFAVIWAINHFNFMDGIDGFCAAQAIFLLSAYAIFFGMNDASFYQDFCFILIFSLIGFLFFNFPPARLFMGDVGSATLGLITFCIALIAQQKFNIAILYWFILNGLFLFDASVTLIRRVFQKENWSLPHRKHAYQRLRQSGVKVSTILLGQLFMNISFLILALCIQMHIAHFSLIALQFGLMLLIYLLIEKKLPMYSAVPS